MESILTLDRLRQSVAVKELEQARGQPITMRKTASVPNFSQVMILVRLWDVCGFTQFLWHIWQALFYQYKEIKVLYVGDQ